MNAIVTIEAAPTAGPHGEGHTLFSPRRQGEFIRNPAFFDAITRQGFARRFN